MSKTIAIAGLGWLGNPFAQHLSLLGYTVKGSVTTPEKAALLQKNGLDAYAVEISEGGVSGAAQGLLKDADVLVIMIPPGLRRNTGADYVLKMSHFLSEVQAASVRQILLVSSTSVYDDEQGMVTENDVPNPQTQAGKQLLQVEQLFFNATMLKTTIVRFGGLIGGSRQPVRYLAGRENLGGGNAPVNLIDRGDCIGILSAIIRQDTYGHIFNAVHPQHPKKKVYYSRKAQELGLEPPKFSEENTDEVYKEINSLNLDAVLGYRFRSDL